MSYRSFSLFLCGVILSLPARASDLILYIGDSYTQGSASPGAHLEPLLGGPSVVKRYAMVGASSLDYAKDMVCPQSGCRAAYSIPGTVKGEAHSPLPADFGGLAKLLGEQTAGPTKVLIALGTNDAEAYCTGGAGMPAAAGRLAAVARDAGASCTWLGPISFIQGSEVFRTCGDRFNQYVMALQKAVTASGCAFVDMRRAGNTAVGCAADNPQYLNPDPAVNCSLHPSDGPGLHFKEGDPQGEIWAQFARSHIQ